MCRLFGFRSVIPSQVHRSLLAAENALGVQSQRHPDGWGVAHYVDGAPHLIRGSDAAFEDAIFRRVSGVVASETVVAHIRNATVGSRHVLNCHPFQHGRWVFAHNGDIPGFERFREAFMEEVNPHLRRFILGETDSEVLFFVFLSVLTRHGPLAQRHGVEEVIAALRETLGTARRLVGGAERPLLTLLVTNGQTMAATQGGKELFWSTHKTRCLDRESCSYFAKECEAPSATGFVNHLIVSSEPLLGENVWHEMREGEIVGVDWRMRLVREGGSPLEVLS